MKQSKYKIYKQTLTNVRSEVLPQKINNFFKKNVKNVQGKYRMKRRGIDTIYYHKYLLHVKQILKAFYGNISEKSFKKIYKKSIVNKNPNYFISLLELRLQTIVYRAGFAKTFAEAKKLIIHGHILVNNKPVTYPGYTLKLNDVIEPNYTMRKHCYNNIASTNVLLLDHIFLQKNILTAIITSMPDVTRIPYPKPFRILDFSIGAGKDLAKIPGMTYTNSPLYDLKENQFYNIYTL